VVHVCEKTGNMVRSYQIPVGHGSEILDIVLTNYEQSAIVQCKRSTTREIRSVKFKMRIRE